MSDAPTLRLPPGPRGLPILGNLLRHERDRLGSMVDAWRSHGDLVRLRMGPSSTVYLVSHPSLVKQVLVDKAANYPKNEGPGALLGNGLFGSEGEFWKRQRGMTQTTFHREKLAGMVEVLVSCIQAQLDRWEPGSRTGARLDCVTEMSDLTFSSLCRLVLTEQPPRHVRDGIEMHIHFLNHPRHELLDWAMSRTPRWIIRRFSRGPAYRAMLREVHGWADAFIQERRRSPPSSWPADILTGLMEARDAAGQGMSDAELRDEMLTLIVGGHEATAVALTWTWYLLHQHPEVEQRLRATVREVLGDRAPTVKDLPALAYAGQVFQEAMRLYPPAWMFSRMAVGPDTLGGYDVLPGTSMSIVPYILHRHPEAWERPESFEPERFSPERSAGRPKFSYLPFGGGQRLCIGNNLAQMKATLFLAMTVQRYRVVAHLDGPLELVSPLTLKPKGGLPISVEPAPDTDAARLRARG